MAIVKIMIALFLKKMSVEQLIKFSRDVQQGMGLDTTDFPQPDPTLAVVKADTDNLEKVEAEYQHDLSLKGARDGARTAVERDITRLASYVVLCAEKATPDKAPAILAAARFTQRKPSLPTKKPFKLQDGPTSGSVYAIIFRKLLAEKHQKLFIYLQYSADGGQHWIDGPSDFKSTILVTGLTAGLTYQFRYRAKVGSQLLDWSQSYPYLVK